MILGPMARRWRDRLGYGVGLLAIVVVLRSADWTWSSTSAAVSAVVVACWTIVALIDERIARWTWPHASAAVRKEATPPRVPDARIWTFSFLFSVPWIEKLVTGRGFPFSRDVFKPPENRLVEVLKVEEFAYRDAIWRSDFSQGALGCCELYLRAQWRQEAGAKEDYLCLILWLDWWRIHEGGRRERGHEVVFEVPLERAVPVQSPSQRYSSNTARISSVSE